VGNPTEKLKLAKDPTTVFNDVYDYAKALRAGELSWEDIEKNELESRLKWVGLLHRGKRTPGRFMMRLRTPNGIVTSDLLRFYADCLAPYSRDVGVIDITTRQNIQLRGIDLADADTIIDGLHARGQTSFQSALDNVRNLVGSPLAGIDHDMVDTRPICEALNDLISLDAATGKRGNPVWGNLPRKFNIAVSGGRDDFAHTHINDIGLQPCPHATTGEMGFNVVLGGYMSIKRVAESIDMNVWIPATVEASVELSRAILRIFRDEGSRGDRTKARLMWLIEAYGEVTTPEGGHPRCSEAYKQAVLTEMDSYGKGIAYDVAQPMPATPFERRALLGVHAQPQQGLSRVGVHVPVGRLSVDEARQLADLADRYSAGECRFTVEQNAILPNVRDELLPALLAEPALNGDSRLSVEPGHIVGNVVSCTGAQFCGLALIETKNNAEAMMKELEARVTVPRALRIHWTGCPNSCGQVQAADIGLMGGPARKLDEASGKMKAVPGVLVFVGGTIGEGGTLAMEPRMKGTPLEDLLPVLTSIVVEDFGGTVKPEFAEEQRLWAEGAAATAAAAADAATAKAAAAAAAVAA